MRKMRIAHISDLHVGDGAKFKEFSLPDGADAPEQEFFGDFERFVRDNNAVADYLVVSGDITNRARFSEVNLASTVVKRIADLLGVEKGKIFFSPGNHDKQWLIEAEVKGASEKDRFAMQYFSLFNTQPGNIFSEISSRDDFASFPYFKVWEDESVLALSCNSAVFDEPSSKPHNGKVTIETINEMERVIKRNGAASSEKLKMMIIHHHALQYSDDFSREHPDFSIMENGNELINMARILKFDLILHGHKHFPQFGISADESLSPVVVVGAGSLSAKIPEKYNGCVGNLFHLIEVERAAPENHFRFKGNIKTWMHRLRHGWEPSDTRFGVEHLLRFGKLINDKDLRDKIEPIIKRKIAENKYMKIDGLGGVDPDVSDVTVRQLNRVLKLICADNDFELDESSGRHVIYG